ncbi:hypothetical protein BDN72DRAFT_879126, partial [Pluteus cervinus]
MPRSQSTSNTPNSQRNPALRRIRAGNVNLNNDTTNNHYDHSQGKTTDNSTNNTTYNGSSHYTIQNNIVGAPPGGRPPIDILRERICVGAAFDSAERGDPPRCHENTRTAILSSSRSWIDTFNAWFLFMWITGWAGVGKSAILQMLAEEYRRTRRLAASFFFFQASHNRSSISGFVATIADQLMESIPGARKIILHKIANNPNIFVNKAFDGLWQTLVVDTLHALHPPSAPMLIVIDGIDEIASLEEQRTLLRTILRSAQQLGSSYKFLIASRPEQQIQMVFEEFSIPEESKIELGNTADTRADIRLFLQASFSIIRHSHNLQSTQAWPKQGVIEHLVDKASGQFIYASTVVEFVRSPDEDPEAALEKIMNRQDVHFKAFRELDRLYLLLMERIQGQTLKKDQHLLHHLLVCIYMHLVREVGDQVELLHPKQSNKELLKILLQKLHPILGTNREYRHKSFIEFLILPSAPHLLSINSWHISGVISLCLPVFWKKKRNIDSLLCFVERASPTQDLVSCLGKMPKGELCSWNSRAGCKERGQLWNNESIHQWTLGWLGYDFGIKGVNLKIDERLEKLRQDEGVT